MEFYWLLLVSITSSYCVKNNLRQRHCVAVKNDIFDSCTTFKNRPFRILDTRQRLDNVTCINNDICRVNISVTYIRRQLYTLHILNRLSEMLDSCCGNLCTNYHIRHTIYRSSAITETVLNTSDIIFPILGTRSVKDMYGFYYIPIHNVPSAYFITLGPTNGEKIIELIQSLCKIWPLILICLVFSFLAGIVIWLFERNLNRLEFPRDLHEGIYEGFWWSFISMTTVGYGDKSPKSCPGRCFAIMWILLGITIFSILTGSLTNQIMSIETLGPQDLIGKTVGGLKHRFHDATMVAQHNGFFKGLEFNNTVDGINELVEKLMKTKTSKKKLKDSEKINGFLINRVSYYYYRWAINTKEKYKQYNETFKKVHLHKTEKDYLGERVCVGMLVKDFHTYQYFRKYFEDNRMQIENCNSFYLNKKATRWESDDSSDTNMDGYGYAFLIIIIALLIFIGVYSVVKVERRKRSQSTSQRNGLIARDEVKEDLDLKVRDFDVPVTV